MTDRNDGRPKHSASHMHCAVPFFCARSGTEGEAAWRCGEWVVRSAGNASRSLRACVGAAGASGSAREGRVAVRGREKAFGGECVVGAARNVSRSLRACVGGAWGSGSARRGRVAVRGREQVFGGKWVVGSVGVHRRCEGSGSARAVRVAVRGRATAFGGECVVGSAGLTHFRRSGSRARVLLYIRLPCHCREIAAMGPKGAPCEHPSPAKTSAFAPSAFTLPRRRSHFSRIPFGGAHEDFGLPLQ